MSFIQMVNLWPTRAAFATDIGATPQAVTNMIKRDSVPARYWADMVRGANERGLDGVTLHALSQAAARREAA